MNWFRFIGGCVALICVLSGGVARAQGQEQRAPSVSSAGDGRIVKSDSVNPTASALDPLTQSKPTIVVPERRLEAQVKARIHEFEAARNAYERRYENLLKQLDGARTADEKNAIRLQIRNALASWREQSEQLREELRQRQRELIRELSHRREALIEDGTPRIRRRPGVDN